MNETQILGFLVPLAALLSAASAMGALARRIGCAPVVGELLAGIVIGKTILGRVWPEAFAWLFRDGSSSVMLHGYKTVAIVLLLVVAGMEINTRSLRYTGKALAFICLLSALVPFVAGYGTGLLLPDHYIVTPSHRELHALFLGIALAISALPVITRTLMDLGLMKTDVGILVLSAAVVNDVVGWICFSALVREMGITDSNAGSGVVVSIGLTTGFLLVAFIGLRPIVDRWLRISERGVSEHASTSRALSMVMALGLLGAAATQMLGIHAVFGGFTVGLAIGSSPHLRPHTRHVLRDCVTSLFTPVFFATMALHYDFVSEFDAGLVAIVVVVASIAKVGGAALGARLGGIANRAAWAIGFGMNSRGAMEILLASVALDAKIINEKMFVALVIMAITTSIISGPAMARLLKVGGLEAAAGQGASRTEPDRAAGSHDLVSKAPQRLS